MKFHEYSLNYRSQLKDLLKTIHQEGNERYYKDKPPKSTRHHKTVRFFPEYSWIFSRNFFPTNSPGVFSDMKNFLGMFRLQWISTDDDRTASYLHVVTSHIS